MSNIQQKVGEYERALADVKAELTQKRTELAAQARQTVESLETSIPRLQAEVNKKSAEITRLDQIIIQKDKEAFKKRDDLEAVYQSRGAQLEHEYETKRASLAEKERLLSYREEGYQNNLKDLKNMQAALDSGNRSLQADREILFNERRIFDVQVSDGNKEIEGLKAKVTHELSLVVSKRQELDNKIKDFSNAQLILKEKEAKAEDIIARIDEANEILEQAEQKEIAARKIQESNNQEFVKFQVEIRKNHTRSSELETRKSELDEREKNIKILESNLVK